jgi:hypothetical protein
LPGHGFKLCDFIAILIEAWIGKVAREAKVEFAGLQLGWCLAFADCCHLLLLYSRENVPRLFEQVGSQPNSPRYL